MISVFDSCPGSSFKELPPLAGFEGSFGQKLPVLEEKTLKKLRLAGRQESSSFMCSLR